MTGIVPAMTPRRHRAGESGISGRYSVQPPSITMACPVTKVLSSLAR